MQPDTSLLHSVRIPLTSRIQDPGPNTEILASKRQKNGIALKPNPGRQDAYLGAKVRPARIFIALRQYHVSIGHITNFQIVKQKILDNDHH